MNTTCDDKEHTVTSTLDDLAGDMILPADRLIRAAHNLDTDAAHQLLTDLDVTQLRALCVVLAAAADPWRTVSDGLGWTAPPADLDETAIASNAATLAAASLAAPRRQAPTPGLAMPDDDVDFELVERVCKGDGLDADGRRYKLNRLEQAEVARYLDGHNTAHSIITRRLGISRVTLTTLLYGPPVDAAA